MKQNLIETHLEGALSILIAERKLFANAHPTDIEGIQAFDEHVNKINTALTVVRNSFNSFWLPRPRKKYRVNGDIRLKVAIMKGSNKSNLIELGMPEIRTLGRANYDLEIQSGSIIEFGPVIDNGDATVIIHRYEQALPHATLTVDIEQLNGISLIPVSHETPHE